MQHRPPTVPRSPARGTPPGALAIAGRASRGAREVAAQALVFRGLAAGARPALVNGAPGLVVFSGNRPFAVMAFATTADAIVEIDIILRPDRLARLGLGALGS